MIFELLDQSDPRWRACVLSWESDIYHLPEYGVATRENSEDVRAALVTTGDQSLLMPMLLREIESTGASDALSPYGYPGPMISQMTDEERLSFCREAIPALIHGLSESGIVSLSVRMHPFVGLEPNDVLAYGTTVYHGDTVVMDLTQSEEELWLQTRKGHRYEINRALKRGHRAYLDAGWEHFNQFLDIYGQTMGRVGATEAYRFRSEYFHALRDALGDHLHLWVVEIDGEIAAASLFTEFNGIVQYHLSGTRSEHLSAQPNKLLLHEVRSWAKARGNQIMHLGGGVGAARDSLFAFKAGFSKQTRPFHTWRLVTIPTAYEALVRQRAMDPSKIDESGFFPAYRNLGD